MTAEEIAKFEALSRCTFAVGSPDKRFVRDMSGATDAALTQRQADYLDRLCFRYRKQLARYVKPAEMLERWIAEGKAKVDARKQAKEKTRLERGTGRDLRHYWAAPDYDGKPDGK